MNIQCDSCKYEFVLPDEKIPDAAKFKLNCPKCREPIIISQSNTAPAEVAAPEHFPHDAKVALCYCADRVLQERIRTFLATKGFYLSECNSDQQAMEKMRLNYYDLVVFDEQGNTKIFYDTIKRWNGIRRRDVNLILVNANAASMHPTEAFLRGVNSVIGRDDGNEIEKYLELALGNFEVYVEPWKVAQSRVQ